MGMAPSALAASERMREKNRKREQVKNFFFLCKLFHTVFHGSSRNGDSPETFYWELGFFPQRNCQCIE